MFGFIDEWIKGFFLGFAQWALQNGFGELNKISGEFHLLSQTPNSFNGTIYEMIRGISDALILPIGGVIITFIAYYELYHLVVDGNNMNALDPAFMVKWLLKISIAVYVLSHMWEIFDGLFALVAEMIPKITVAATAQIGEETIKTLVDSWKANVGMGGGEAAFTALTATLFWFIAMGATIATKIVLLGRFINIYLTLTLAPIPMATLANREWGVMGTNYIKQIAALAFQAVIMAVCFAIFANIIQTVDYTDPMGGLTQVLITSILLVYSLFGSNNLTRSIFGAH